MTFTNKELQALGASPFAIEFRTFRRQHLKLRQTEIAWLIGIGVTWIRWYETGDTHTYPQAFIEEKLRAFMAKWQAASKFDTDHLRQHFKIARKEHRAEVRARTLAAKRTTQSRAA